MKPQYLHVAPGGPNPDVEAAPYRLILVSEATYDSGWQKSLAEHLVASGCLYFVAWGIQCSLWHDAVDHANLAVHDYGDIPDESFIMTTWHEKEPLVETFWFAEYCAHHPDVELQASYILHLASKPDPTRILTLYDDARSARLDKNGLASWEDGYDPSSLK